MSCWSVEALFSDPRFIAHLRRLLRLHARRRYPAMQGLADDLISASVESLWQYAQTHEELFRDLDPSAPQPWSGPAWDTLTRLARTFLTRRAVDLHRKAAGQWARDQLAAHYSSAEGDPPEPLAREPSHARHHLLRQMMVICLDELSRASETDREALWAAIDKGTGLVPMSDAERQRASRLRRRLGLAIRDRLGESAASLLASDLQDEE